MSPAGDWCRYSCCSCCSWCRRRRDVSGYWSSKSTRTLSLSVGLEGCLAFSLNGWLSHCPADWLTDSARLRRSTTDISGSRYIPPLPPSLHLSIARLCLPLSLSLPLHGSHNPDQSTPLAFLVVFITKFSVTSATSWVRHALSRSVSAATWRVTLGGWMND